MTKVTVYTTPSCPQCMTTKKMLDKNNIVYEVVDLSQDTDALEYVRSLGYTAAPVVEVGDQHWSGFRHGYLTNLIQAIHGSEAHAPVKEPAAA